MCVRVCVCVCDVMCMSECAWLYERVCGRAQVGYSNARTEHCPHLSFLVVTASTISPSYTPCASSIHAPASAPAPAPAHAPALAPAPAPACTPAPASALACAAALAPAPVGTTPGVCTTCRHSSGQIHVGHTPHTTRPAASTMRTLRMPKHCTATWCDGDAPTPIPPQPPHTPSPQNRLYKLHQEGPF